MFIDCVTTFEPQERGYLSISNCTTNIGCIAGKLPGFRMLLGEVLHCRYLIVCSFNRSWSATTKHLWFNPNRKELCVQSTGLCSHGIEVTVVQLLLKIDFFIEYSLHCVNVHVDGDRAEANSRRITRQRRS